MAWYDNIAGLSQMALPVTIERGKPAPLDKYSLFDNYDSAMTFAREHASAFIGAFVYVLADGAVGENGAISGTLGAYIITGIGENAELHKLAESSPTGDLAGDVAALQAKVNTLLADDNTTGSVDQKVKAAIDAYKAINDPLVEGLRTDVDANKAAADASIAALVSKDGELEQSIADNKAAADASIAALVSKDSELEQSIADNKAAADASIAALVSKDSELSQAITDNKVAADASIAALVSKDNELSQAITDNKAAADASIAALVAKDNELSQAIADNKAAADASINALVAKDNELSQTIADNKAAADASIADLENKIANVPVYDLQSVEDPAEEWAAQYIFSKDGETVTTINIPKDQFLKEASYVAAATAEDVAADASVVEGDPYLKFVWQLSDSQATTYVPVKELVDTYTGSTYINVNGKQIVLNYDALLAQIKIDIIDTINGQLSDLEDKDAELEQAIADNKAAADASIAALSQTIADNKAAADASIGELSQTIADNKAAADASIGELSQAITDNKAAADASIAALVAKDGELEQSIADNKAAADASIAALSQTITDNKAAADASIAALVAKDSELEQSIADNKAAADASIAALVSKDSKLEQAIADNKAAADASIAALVTKDGELEQSIADNKAAADASIAALVAKDNELSQSIADNKAAADASIAKIESATVNGVAFNKDEEGNLSVNVEAGSIKIGVDIDESITSGSSVADAFSQIIAKIDAKEVGVVSVSANSTDNAVFVNNTDPANPVVGLNVSAEAGNILSVKADGVYAAMEWQSI